MNLIDSVDLAALRARLVARPYLVLGAIAVLVHMVVMGLRMRGGYFQIDDFYNFWVVRDHGQRWQALFEPDTGQVAPLFRLTNLIVFNVVGLNHFVTLGLSLTTTASCVALLAMTAARGRTPLWLAAGCVMVAAVTWVPAQSLWWWSSSVHVVFSTFFALCAIYVAANPVRQLSRRQKAALMLFGALGLGFYTKTGLALVLCGIIRFYIRRCHPGRPVWRDLLGALSDLTFAIGALAAYVALFEVVHVRAPINVAPVGLIVSSVLAGLQHGWLGALVGIRSALFTPGANRMASVVGDLVAIATVFAALRQNPRTVWLWIGLPLCIAGGLTLIAATRAVAYGTWVVFEPRYNVDGVFEALAVVVIAFGGIYGSAPSAQRAGSRTRLVGILILVGVGALHASGAWTYPIGWDTRPVRAFVQQLKRDSTGVAHGGAIVGQRTMPQAVVGPIPRDVGVLSQFAIILPKPFVVGPWDVATHQLDDQGRLHSFASLPRLNLVDLDGRHVTVALVAPFEGGGEIDGLSATLIQGWTGSNIASAGQVQVVITDGARIAARATTLGEDGSKTRFQAKLPAPIPPGRLHAYLLIDRRIAIVLPIDK